jgi:hypothetical protein
MAKNKAPHKKNVKIRRPWFFIGLGALIVIFVPLGTWWASNSKAQAPHEAPEAQMVMDLQANMPFQILIPAYLPKEFQRENLKIDISQAGPGGEPMVQLTYATKKNQALFIKEWVPVNPDKEVLASSRPIQTKWGDGWLLRQGAELIAIWVDIGPMRASIYTTDQELISREDLLAIAENMGPASNRQVFSFIVDPPEIRAVEPPPPVEATVGADGVQEIDLIVTPGGYDPLRISVKAGVPVRLTFRQLGRVGCGNELNFPVAPGEYASITIDEPDEVEVYEFTPTTTGTFEFFCAHLMYKGLLVVRP